MQEQKIRPIALCVFRQDTRILVFEGHDTVKNQTFYRLLGGGIEFGETSRDAAIREMKEELNADICNLSYLGALENIFVYENVPGHEIVQLYQADFVDQTFYTKERLQAVEDNGVSFDAYWKELEIFKNGEAPLYPHGLLDLILQQM